MNKHYQLIVFDWDGTLMDSESHIIDCMQAAISDLSIETRTDEDIRNIIGLGLTPAIQTLYPKMQTGMVEKFVERYRHFFLYQKTDPSELFEQAEQVLNQLINEQRQLAIATGKGRLGLDKVLEATGLTDMFAHSRCADETQSKPHPDMLLEIMDFMDVAAESTLMIGDTEYDMLMAKNANVDAIAVSYGAHALERLLQHDPICHIDAISELPDKIIHSAVKKTAS